MGEFINRAKNQVDFYYIEVRSKENYKTFRTHAAAGEEGIERVSGQREDGSWDTVKWLVSKEMAHVEGDTLIADHPAAKELFDKLGAAPKLIENNHFEAKKENEAIEK